MGGSRKTGTARTFVLASLAAILALCSSIAVSRAQDAVEPPTDEEIILDRQLAMQQLEEHADALGGVLAGVEPPEMLAQYTRQVADDAAAARAAFQAQVPGGSTKPEAWANWEDFSRRMDEMVTRTEAMAVAGETGSVGMINEMVVDALPCGACHQLYRVPRRPHEPNGAS